MTATLFDLRKRVADAGNAQVIRLAPGDYRVTDPPLQIRNRTIVGYRHATFRPDPSDDREASCIVLRGQAPRLLGCKIVGNMPAGHGYDKHREAQHAVRIDGAISPEVARNEFDSVWGDGVYLGREYATKAWTRNAFIHDNVYRNIGRHHITPDGAEGLIVTGETFYRCNRSLVCIEPPGKAWGARYFQWLDTDIWDEPNHFPVLASKGEGSSTSVHHITLDGIRCHNRPFTVTVNPIPAQGDPPIRRSYWVVRHCAGQGPEGVSRPQITLRNVDHGAIDDIDQPMARGPLVEAIGCTDIVHDGKRIAA